MTCTLDTTFLNSLRISQLVTNSAVRITSALVYRSSGEAEEPIMSTPCSSHLLIPKFLNFTNYYAVDPIWFKYTSLKIVPEYYINISRVPDIQLISITQLIISIRRYSRSIHDR
jgi:hypothetical protein